MLKINTKKEKKPKEENKKKSIVPRYIIFLILSIILGGIFTALTSYAATIAASNISYSNTTSGLTATNAQSAIDEVYLNSKRYLYWNGTSQVYSVDETQLKNDTSRPYIDLGKMQVCVYGTNWDCKSFSEIYTTPFGCYGSGSASYQTDRCNSEKFYVASGGNSCNAPWLQSGNISTGQFIGCRCKSTNCCCIGTYISCGGEPRYSMCNGYYDSPH